MMCPSCNIEQTPGEDGMCPGCGANMSGDMSGGEAATGGDTAGGEAAAAPAEGGGDMAGGEAAPEAGGDAAAM